MIKTRLYLYDKDAENYKGREFTNNILLGETETNDLTEELDTKEITLSGLDIKDAFDPTTKFIEEIFDDEYLVETQNWIVQQDLVEKPILSDSNYYKHSISLIEPSAIAQQRTCDNFAITYKLSDIKLETESTVDTSLIAYGVTNTTGSQTTNQPTNALVITETTDYSESGVFVVSNSFKYDWVFKDNAEKDKWEQLKVYRQVGDQISLTIPLLRIQCYTYSYKDVLGYCSVDALITKRRGSNLYYYNNGNWQETKNIITVHPATSTEGNWKTDPNIEYGYSGTTGCILNRCATVYEEEKILFETYGYNYRYDYIKQVAKYISNPTNREINFTIEDSCVYEIKLNIHNFESQDGITVKFGDKNLSNTPQKIGELYKKAVYDSTTYPSTYYDYEGTYLTYYESTTLFSQGYYSQVTTTKVISASDPAINSATYAYLENNKSYFISSAPPLNAYDLFLKSIIMSQSLNKNQDTWNGFLDELTFYTSVDSKSMLEGTQIVEAIYSQKNLWEMFIEIGKYIHSIPKIVFGENDRFLVEWQKLGLAGAEYTGSNTSTQISIFNSKKLEEYVNACDSYITNMVQLGGQIDEWIAPKSSSEDYLVYNDVVELKTSKPILEILNMEVKSLLNGEIRNLVGKGISLESKFGYIFESSVYQLLSIQATDNVNKGLAIYYELGKNIISGLTYKLPTINSGDVDDNYAIKRIIGTVFGMAKSNWANIKVNDYVFHIVYRTKDSLREVQTRPDLRKYLINSKFDRAPIHKQFNNQTDIVSDSIKFGNSIYGTLIKTGNLGYTMSEWCSSYADVKKVGFLYNINNNLYYLSKITKVYNGTEIMCQLEFSKDYNQLSAIIGIPSEPRFYEISERNIIQREVVWNEYFMVGTTPDTATPIVKKNLSYIQNMLFSNQTAYPTYCALVMKNILDKPINNENIIGDETFYKTFMLPLSVYSCKNTLTFECDTIDNFSAGDQVGIDEVSPIEPTTDNAYRTLLPYQYCDPMGRADMYEFAIITPDINGNATIIRNMPACPYGTTADGKTPISANNILFNTENFGNYLKGNGIISNKTGLMVLKDSREQISYNYNLQMLTDSDRFVLSGYLWQLNKSNVGLVLLNDEINKISNDTIPTQYIIGWNGIFNEFSTPLIMSNDGNIVTIDIRNSLLAKFTQEQIESAKAIAIISSNISTYNTNEQYFVMGRNVSDLDFDNKTTNWYLKEYDVSKARENTDLPS